MFYSGIARYFYELNNEDLEARPLNYYRNRYLEYIKAKGLAKLSGRINARRIKEMFLTFYPLEFLKLFNLEFDVDEEQTWVQMILQKNRKSFHPIMHLLMMIFLCGSAKEFFNNNYLFNPLGNGPWECLNPVCTNHKKQVIKSVKLGYSNDNKQIYGVLECKCGFKYRIYHSARFKPFVEERGRLWEQTAKELIRDGHGLHAIAERLQVDIQTVKKFALRNNLQTNWKEMKVKNEDEVLKQFYQDENYEKWTELVENNKGLSKTELRKLAPAVYAWLYRNDKKWLDENSPSKHQVKQEGDKVNWDERDLFLLMEVKEIVNDWGKKEDKPKRMFKQAIINKTKNHLKNLRRK